MIKGAASLIGVAILSSLATISRAIAQDKITKATVKYQDGPNAGNDCNDCIQFIAGKTPKDNGTCKVVEGRISPNGYCLAFTPKPKQG